MSLEHWRLEQLGRGNSAAAKIAEGLIEQFGDVEPPSVSTPEALVEVKRFSKEQREALGKQGFVVYELTGQSIKTLRDSGCKFWLTWRKNYPDFEALESMHGEVAVNPNRLFLPNSNNKTLAQQEKMVEKFSLEIGNKIPGVKAIIGQAADYAELAFKHLKETEDHLFGEKDNYCYTRTRTPLGGPRVADVGRFAAGSGLSVDRWDVGDGSSPMPVAPLVVPA